MYAVTRNVSGRQKFLTEERDDGSTIWSPYLDEAIVFTEIGDAIDMLTDLLQKFSPGDLNVEDTTT